MQSFFFFSSQANAPVRDLLLDFHSQGGAFGGRLSWVSSSKFHLVRSPTMPYRHQHQGQVVGALQLVSESSFSGQSMLSVNLYSIVSAMTQSKEVSLCVIVPD